MKEQITKICKIVEIHIQESNDYQACIGTGHYTERFNGITGNIEPIIAAEVERRIAERMPSEEELNKEANTYGRLVKENLGNNFMDYGVEENASLDFLRGAAWCRSRLAKTEGGGE